MQQYGSKYFVVRPLPEPDPHPALQTLGLGSKGQNYFFFITWSCCILS